MPAIQPQIKPLLVHRIVSILLAYLNCHTYILFVVVFTFVERLAPGSDLLVVCSRRLVVADYYYYYCLSNNHRWSFTKVERAGGLLLSWSTGRDGWLLQA